MVRNICNLSYWGGTDRSMDVQSQPWGKVSESLYPKQAGHLVHTAMSGTRKVGGRRITV
jgi:hypothetical protein